MPAAKTVRVENNNVPGRTSKINADKYAAMRQALLQTLPSNSPGITQVEMAKGVLPHLPQDLWPNGDKSMWWVKTVQLDLEAKGLVTRNRAAKPTRWHLT